MDSILGEIPRLVHGVGFCGDSAFHSEEGSLNYLTIHRTGSCRRHTVITTWRGWSMSAQVPGFKDAGGCKSTVHAPMACTRMMHVTSLHLGLVVSRNRVDQMPRSVRFAGLQGLRPNVRPLRPFLPLFARERLLRPTAPQAPGQGGRGGGGAKGDTNLPCPIALHCTPGGPLV